VFDEALRRRAIVIPPSSLHSGRRPFLRAAFVLPDRWMASLRSQ